MKVINPLSDIGFELNSVESPSRYIGGEYGSIVKKQQEQDTLFNFAIAFPDLYEIGMSNTAIKILYNGLNAYDDVRCERVFTVESDFEALLKKKHIPLYTLETGMPLNQVDMIGFSIGYELGITGVLSCLELGNVPLLAKERAESDPIIIAGGCGVTNPAPISDFFDAIFIGEAEQSFFELIELLASKKRNGSSRAELLDCLDEYPSVWTKKSQSSKITRRAVQNDFGLVRSVPSWFPIANLKPVQDHGVVEIMRGCPNGCRFCHAGIYYRPQRVKNRNLIVEETDHIVFDAGCREISLTSLSSADYPDIEDLLDTLNERYRGYNVSFQLPSLKVNSLSLPILEKLSTVRKSGLTFAVETPEEAWQLSLNKEVYAQHLVDIIKEAKNKGWGTAKFYFMIGLPVGDYFGKENNPTGKSEEETIVDFLLDLQARTKIQCNVNVGIFIPKPHTPYQWVRQITPEAAQAKLDYIFAHLPRGKFKLSRHNYDTTILEGLISRGDERAGQVIYAAYKKGARLDAWEEHLVNNMPYWNEAFAEAGWNVKEYLFKDWSLDEKLPWDSVSLGPSKAFFKSEWQKSLDHVLTKKCSFLCEHKCGVCNDKEQISVHSPCIVEKVSDSIQNKTIVTPCLYPDSNIQVLYRVLFTFKRASGAEFTAYLSQVEMFHKAFLRCGLPIVFTNGFNPLPRVEFATAMTLGIPSLEEIGSCMLYSEMKDTDFVKRMNEVLPSFFTMTKAFIFPVTNQRKRESLSESLWGSVYEYRFRTSYDPFVFFKSNEAEPFMTTAVDGAHVILHAQNGETLLEPATIKNMNLSFDAENDFFTVSVPFALDKPFRTAIEEKYGAKPYMIASILKKNTLAKPDVTGWTALDEVSWRTHEEPSVDDVSKQKKADPVSFYHLYEEIARINVALIEDRKEFNKKRDEFYAQHPEVLAKRKAQQSTKED